MQFRELSVSEMDEGYILLSMLRLELTPSQFDAFITAHCPKDYRPVGAYERGTLCIYAGVSIRENLEIGRHLIVDDFVALEGYECFSREMIDFIGDYAKLHKCQTVLLSGKHRGLSLTDLQGFRPKRDGFIKIF
ncbi:MAG: hypothetical protein PHW64_00740 [Sulfuricurvum sp.]|nr:hypothetical protein [Sulfuricurvum sp.]